MSGISETKMTSEISYDSKRFFVASTLEIEYYYACCIVKDFTGLSLSEAVVFSGCYPYVILLLNNSNEHTIPKIRNNGDLQINSPKHKIFLYIFQSDTYIKKELDISYYVR